MTQPAVSRETTSAEVFGDRLEVARRFADILRTDGITRGLIGPREADRVWERHVLNCAALAPALPDESSVLDVGSGAGLPGLVLAIARPDTAVTLLEPLQRRVNFLREAIAALGLSVTVVRGRAEDVVRLRRARDGGRTNPRTHDRRTGAAPTVAETGEAATVAPVDVVTARAVAPLSRLADWCLPLLRPGGVLLAVKGERAAAELESAGELLGALGATSWSLEDYRIDGLQPATRVVRVVAGQP